MRLAFYCPCCGRETLSGEEHPGLTTGYDADFNWFQAASDSRSISPLHQLPAPSTEGVLEVKYPFQGQVGTRFWTLFQPSLSRYNGWEEHPEEIEQSGFVCCRVLEILETTPKQAKIRVCLEKIFLLGAVLNTISETPDQGLLTSHLFDFPQRHFYTWGDWVYYSGTAQGDLGQWLLLRKHNQGLNLHLFGDWDFHRAFCYFGNLRLSQNTLLKLQDWGLPKQ